jgi:exosortase B
MDAVAAEPVARRNALVALITRHWPLLAGFAVIILPSFVRLAQTVWSTDAGVHGPIVLATGAWLLARAWPTVRAEAHPGSPIIGWTTIIASLCLYAFARAFDFISLEVAGALGLLLGTAWLYFGPQVLLKLWFPILYLGFMIPLPGWFIDTATAPLKSLITHSATSILSAAGYPIAREGVTLFVAQYQLLVEDACAGLNSIVSLTSISLFYIYLLHNASWRYSAFLMAWILPAAIVANLVRVIILVLITYYYGNAMAQGFLHKSAGLLMFVVALLFIFAVDRLMDPVRLRLANRGAAT